MINDLGGTSWNPMTQIGTGVYSKNMYGSLSAGYFTPDLFTLALDSYTKDDFGFDIQAYASGEYYGKTLFIQYSSEKDCQRLNDSCSRVYDESAHASPTTTFFGS